MTIMPLIAYHGLETNKAAILATLLAHRTADELIQGYGYWKDGKGCAVGCTIHSTNHMLYESKFGIPVAIARLEDAIFEELPVDLARQWPERLMSAIQPGQDLSRVHWHLLHWLLTTPEVNPGIVHPLVSNAVKQCADVIADLAAGNALDESAAWAASTAAASARSAARSAAKSAESAAESAAWSAEWSAESASWSAWSAELAADSAESAAWSAADSAAESAAESARSAAWVKISKQLIAFIEVAPMNFEVVHR